MNEKHIMRLELKRAGLLEEVRKLDVRIDRLMALNNKSQPQENV